MSDNDIWIFGYGSLVWRPGFEFEQTEIARLASYARSFCMWSIHHRGTPEKMGLVLALDHCEGTHCDGIAFRVSDVNAPAVLEYLRERELISSAYLEIKTDVTLKSGDVVNAYTYVIDPNHEQYVNDLTLDDQAKIIANAVGGMGPNSEYLFNVAKHLEDLGIKDAELNDLSNKVRALI